MQRIIKFRGKRVDNGEWVYGYLIISETVFDKNQHCIIEIKNHFNTASTRNGNLCYMEAYSRVHKVDPATVGQFTGLTDKKGKEIYEGDIINVTNKGIYNGNRVVVFDESLLCYVLVWAELIDSWNGTQHGTTFLKVSSGIKCNLIGNIHENPELCKG